MRSQSDMMQEMESKAPSLSSIAVHLRKIVWRLLPYNSAIRKTTDIKLIKTYIEDYIVCCFMRPNNTPSLSEQEFFVLCCLFNILVKWNMDKQLVCLLLAMILPIAQDHVAKKYFQYIQQTPQLATCPEYKYVMVTKIISPFFVQIFAPDARREIVTRIVEKGMQDAGQDRFVKVLLLQALLIATFKKKNVCLYQQQAAIIGDRPLLVPLGHRVLNVGTLVGISWYETVFEIKNEDLFDHDQRLECARYMWNYCRASLSTPYNGVMAPESADGLVRLFETSSTEYVRLLKIRDQYDDINNILDVLQGESVSEEFMCRFVHMAYSKYERLWRPYESCFTSNRHIFLEYVKTLHTALIDPTPAHQTSLLLSAYAVAIQLLASAGVTSTFRLLLQTLEIPTWRVAKNLLRSNLLMFTFRVYNLFVANDDIIEECKMFVCDQLQMHGTTLKNDAFIVGKFLLETNRKSEHDNHLSILLSTAFLSAEEFGQYVVNVYYMMPFKHAVGLTRYWAKNENLQSTALHYLNSSYDLQVIIKNVGCTNSITAPESDTLNNLATACYDFAGVLEELDELQLALEVLQRTPLTCSRVLRLTYELAVVSIRRRMGERVANQLSVLMEFYRNVPNISNTELFKGMHCQYVRAILDECNYVKDDSVYRELLTKAAASLELLCKAELTPDSMSRSCNLELLGELYDKLDMPLEAVKAYTEAQTLWEQGFVG